jgi:hypothetical protein
MSQLKTLERSSEITKDKLDEAHDIYGNELLSNVGVIATDYLIPQTMQLHEI